MENLFNLTSLEEDFNATVNGTVSRRLGMFINPFNQIHTRVTFCILYSIIFTCCIIGNCLVLCIIIKNIRMRTRTNFFLANLAVANFCVGIFCVFPNLSTYLSPAWHLGKVMCKLYYFVHYMSLTVPVLFLTVISIERYIAILHPLKARQWFTFRRLKILQVLIWLFLVVYNSPHLVDYDTFVIGNVTFCYMRSANINTNVYVLANLIIWYVIPLSVLTFIYIKIATVLWQSSTSKNFVFTSTTSKQKNNRDTQLHSSIENNDIEIIKKSKGCPCLNLKSIPRRRNKIKLTLSCKESYVENENTSEYERDFRCNTEIYSLDSIPSGSSSMKEGSSNGNNLQRVAIVKDSFNNSNKTNQNRTEKLHPIKNQRINTHKAIKARRKVVILLVMIIGSFAVLVFPYYIRSCLYLWTNTQSQVSLFSPICYLLYYANSGLNPFLYALVSNNFRKSFKETFKCRRGN
ncbi:trissin receptor-like [Argonauta hians]